MQTNKLKNQISVFIPTRSTIREKEEEKTPSRSSITGFSADMDTGRMTRFAGDGQGNLISSTTYNGIPEQVFQQYGDLVRQGQVQQQKQIANAKKQREISDAALGSALVYAKQNKGFIPPSMTEALSAQLGMPIVGGNYTNDGQFVIYGRKQLQSANGMVSGERIEPIAVATPEMQYGILKKTGLGQSLQQEIYDSLSRRFTQQQLKDRGITDHSALSQKDAIALADAKMKLRKNEFDMRNSHLHNLSAQRKALVDQQQTEGVDNTEKIAALDDAINTINAANSASLGITEFARALGVINPEGVQKKAVIQKKVVNNNPAKYQSTSSVEMSGGKVIAPEQLVESNGEMVKRVEFNSDTGEFIVNTKHEQPDGSYSFRVSKDKAHLGEKWVTYVDEDGKVKQRRREKDDDFIEQHDSGLYIKVRKPNGKTTELFVPAGKIIKTPFGNKLVDGEKGEYTLVDTDEKPNWTAREGIMANWANRDTEKRRNGVDRGMTNKDFMKLGKEVYRKETNADIGIPPMGIDIEPNIEDLIKLGKKHYRTKHSRANWGSRRRGGTGAVQKANQILDELVAKELGMSIEEAGLARRIDEEKKSKVDKKYEESLNKHKEYLEHNRIMNVALWQTNRLTDYMERFRKAFDDQDKLEAAKVMLELENDPALKNYRGPWRIDDVIEKMKERIWEIPSR